MVGILLDLRTGDPILGDNGDYIPIDNEEAFKQIITMLFYCQVGSEIFNIYYGFDLESAVRCNSGGLPTDVLKSYVMDALDPNKERLIFNINSVAVERDGQQANVKISVLSKFSTTATLTQTINGV